MQVESDPEITTVELAIILASFLFILAALTILAIFLLKRGKKSKETENNSTSVGGKEGADNEATL